jgi:hypothetical protein
MKRQLFLYLFLFALLLVVFQYVNSKSIIEVYENDISELKKKRAEQDSLNQILIDENFDLSYFKFNRNEEAMSYFEREDLDIDRLQDNIMDALYETNVYEGEEHPLIPYVSMTDRPIVINKARILNHRWIIADYTDGQHNGEIFLNYSVVSMDSISFKLTDYLMFPKY